MTRRPRRTLLKIRATPLRRMPKSVFFEKIRQAARTGIIPDDIELSTLNWGHAVGRRFSPGETLDATDRRELENVYNYLTGTDPDIRFERPD